MDQRDSRQAVSDIYLLIALCTRAEGHAEFDARLLDQVSRFNQWNELPAQTERHGMGPLVYRHLSRVGAPIPAETRRRLQGQYLRQKHANRIFTRQLARVLAAFAAADIKPLLLKGAALAHLVYPDPALRPRSDIDILVRDTEAFRARDILTALGFSASLPLGDQLPLRHFLPVALVDDGVPVLIELHHWDGRADDPAPREPLLYPYFAEYAGFDAPPLTFTVETELGYAPSAEALFRTLNKHLVRHLLKGQTGLRLIWQADLVSLAERYTREIDWDRLQRIDPAVLERLALCYSFTPPAPNSGIPISPASRPTGIDHYFEGWPRQTVFGLRPKQLWKLLQETFAPAEWWLAFHYGVSEPQRLLLVRWWWHPVQILHLAVTLLVKRVRAGGRSTFSAG